MILLDGDSLTLDDLAAIAYERAPVSLPDDARDIAEISRFIASGEIDLACAMKVN